ncbi:MAG: hypothetical protein CVV06_06770 [Gammaproteobacteria bacterium HGW-Gammaproteobacteria-10]|nr:MAG: hypothetical protein CVV06_06770 [Gammaproteobacteria bacterium HGW-Gammaproteobacteria-10]
MRRLIVIGCWLSSLLICVPQCLGDTQSITITAILSRDAEPYQEVLEGVRQAFSVSGFRIELDVHVYKDASDNAPIKAVVSASRSRAVLSLGSQATGFAISEFSELPICAGLIVDEKALGDSENVTGLVLKFPLEIELQWLKMFIGSDKSIAVLYHEEKSGAELGRAQQLAEQIGLRLHAQAVNDHSDLPSVLKRLPQNTGALWSFAESGILNAQTAKHVLLYSFRNRIPLVGLSNQWTKAGALYSLDRDYFDIGVQCGEKIVKILNGIPPEQIPVEPPRKVFYSINMKTLRHMKLELPESLIQDAHEVF